MSPERLNITKFLKTSDRMAFEWLYLKHEKEFTRYARVLTGDLDHGKDIIQLTCLQILQYDGRHKDPDTFNFKNFFCRSMHNTMINMFRKKRKTVELDTDLVIIAPGLYQEPDFNPLLFYIEKLLTPDQKEVMYFRMKGIKFKRIASIMGVSTNTAVGMFRYGRRRLEEYKNEILKT